jgi:rubrerythrin
MVRSDRQAAHECGGAGFAPVPAVPLSWGCDTSQGANAMVDMAMISGAVSALKAAGDIAKLMIASHDAGVIRQKAIELQAQIFTAQSNALAAQSDQFTLLESVRELKKQIADLEAWETEKQRYELKRVATGALVYSLKPDASGSEPPHWICTTCYQNGRKSFMQQLVVQGLAHNNGGTIWICPACSMKILIPFDWR